MVVVEVVLAYSWALAVRVGDRSWGWAPRVLRSLASAAGVEEEGRKTVVPVLVVVGAYSWASPAAVRSWAAALVEPHTWAWPEPEGQNSSA